MNKIGYSISLLLAGALLSTCTRQELITRDRGLTFTTRFEQLPYLKTGTQTYQYSSTDPAEDQFNDYFHWLRTESDSSAVLADINGPGCIYRIWSTGNVGDSNRIKIYLDGNPRPAIDSHTTGRHRR